jgi:hypothetical protein
VLNGLEIAPVGPAILVRPVSGLATSEDGDSVDLAVQLTAAPAADVSVNFAVTDATEGAVSPANMVFTSQNWNTPQSIVVTGVDDVELDGPMDFRVTSVAVSSDPVYDGLVGEEIVVTNLDNEQPNTPLRFDMGTATSPVETGFERVSAATVYSPSSGYGWSSSQSGSLDSRDRAIGTAPVSLTRDFVFSTQLTFLVDVNNGAYDVTLTFGDATYHHDQMSVVLEGAAVDNVSTAVGEFVSRTYQVDVNDGQLTLLIDDLGGSGGSGPYAVLNGVEISAAAQQAAAAAVDSPTATTSAASSVRRDWADAPLGCARQAARTSDRAESGFVNSLRNARAASSGYVSRDVPVRRYETRTPVETNEPTLPWRRVDAAFLTLEFLNEIDQLAL